MADAHRRELAAFAAEKSFRGKGPLSVALVVTQHARKMGLPLDSEKLLTEGGGQVLGLGKRAVQAILKRHGVARVLASEGGRTSRGSLNNMREYAALLNDLREQGPVDLDAIEAFWIERVHEFFADQVGCFAESAGGRARRDRPSRGAAEDLTRRVLRWRSAATSGRHQTGWRARERKRPTQQLLDRGRARRARR